MSQFVNRRSILKSMLSFSALMVAGPLAWAKSKKPANAADPSKPGMAQAMKYVENGADAAKNPATKSMYKLGSNCGSCSKYVCAASDKACKPAKKTDDYGPCKIFPGKTVARKGWCLSYTAKKS